MDEILYLEPDEEITSVIDKIKQSKATRLGLVVPRDATLLQSVVNLRLLQKEVLNLGKEIAVVTSDKIGRNLAAKVGLTVYESVKNPQPIFQPPSPIPSREEIIEIDDSPQEVQAEVPPKGVQVHHFQEGSPVEKPEKIETPAVVNTPRPQIKARYVPPKVHREIDWSKSRKLIWPIAAIVVILLLIGAFLIFPKVNVKLKVQAENFNKSTESQISSTEPTSFETKTYAGKLIDLSQEKEEKFLTTGKKNLGGKASGTITIYNNLDSNSHNFNVGTKLSSSSKTFILKNNISVPGGGIQNGKPVAGTTNADVEAENAGEEYNVSAGRFTIVGLPAASQEFIYGQSSKDLTGGFSKEVQVVSQSDYDNAKAKITGELNEALKKDLQDQSKGMEMLENAIDTSTVEENSSAKVDSEAQEFTLKIKARLREMVFTRSEFDTYILSLLEKQIPSTEMLSLGPNDTISPQVVAKNYDQNQLKLNVQVSAKISTRIDEDKVKDNLLGKSKNEAENYLKNYEGLASSEITFKPSWWPLKRIPSYRRNLNVNLDYTSPESSSNPMTSPSPSSEATNE